MVFVFVPGDDFFLAESDVAPVEFDPLAGQGVGSDFFHGGGPVGGADGVAFSPFHVKGETGSGDATYKRVEAFSPRFMRVVADCNVCLVAIFGVHRGVPVGNATAREGLVNGVFGSGHPASGLVGSEGVTEAAEGVFAAQALFGEAEDLGHGEVVLEPSHMGEALAADEAVEGEGSEDVFDRGGVRAGALEGVSGGQIFKDPGAGNEVVPGDQTSVSSEISVAGSEVIFSTGGVEFEME